MLDKNDLLMIREAIHEVVGDVMEEIVLPRFEGIDRRLDGIDGRLEGIDRRLDGTDGRLGRIEATMVTRDFLEDRLADFRASLAHSADWVGRQLKRLTHELHKGNVLHAEQVIQIHAN